MLTTILICTGVSILVAGVAYVAVRQTAARHTTQDLEGQIGPRLDRLLTEINAVRGETRQTIQEKISEVQRASAEENRAARKEVQVSLAEFRQTLSTEQGKGRQESREALESVTKSLTERFEKLQDSNEKRLESIRGEVEKKLSETIRTSGETFKDVLDRLNELKETNQRIMQFSRDLTELQSILQAPKLRGELGEMEMERMLRDCLAEGQFDTQHALGGGRVDAVILNPEGKLPIDSKFPLDAWRRLRNIELTESERASAKREFIKAVRKHVDDIRVKYIHPPETLDFAVMYVPAEGVYYELIETPELMEHAGKSRVFPASPMTFWALLQVTVIGFRGLQISENAKRIGGLLAGMQSDMLTFREAFSKASNQIRHAGKNMDDAEKQLDRVDSKLDTIRSSQVEDGERPGAKVIAPPEDLLNS